MATATKVLSTLQNEGLIRTVPGVGSVGGGRAAGGTARAAAQQFAAETR